MDFNTLLVKFLEGITNTKDRADLIATFGLIKSLYESGRIDDSRVIQALNELCLDVLMSKYITKDIDELKPEAEEWAKRFYRSLRIATVRDRYLSLAGVR
jgi:hypothetical protein